MDAATLPSVILATGRRKTASARVRLHPEGSGKFTVNGRELTEYCYSEDLTRIAQTPLVTVEMLGKVDIEAKVIGGGPIGQASAISHALARALEKLNPELRPALKSAGLLRRDPRMRERKKAGQPGARRRFQFSKR